MAYAEGTTVSAERSQEEVKSILRKHGASHIMVGEAPDLTAIQFRLDGLMYRFDVQRPTAPELRAAFIGARSGDWRAEQSARRVDWNGRVAAEWRRRWRARVLWLKSLIEFAEDVPLHQSMMANLVLPDGRQMAHWAAPQVEAMYATGEMPKMLGDGS